MTQACCLAVTDCVRRAVEVVSGAVTASISGGSARNIYSSQVCEKKRPELDVWIFDRSTCKPPDEESIVGGAFLLKPTS